jgi:hypothetical protein
MVSRRLQPHTDQFEPVGVFEDLEEARAVYREHDDEAVQCFEGSRRDAGQRASDRLRCPDEAAAALGISRDYFNAHVRPDLRLIRKGRLVLVLVSELERWGRDSAARVL